MSLAKERLGKRIVSMSPYAKDKAATEEERLASGEFKLMTRKLNMQSGIGTRL